MSQREPRVEVVDIVLPLERSEDQASWKKAAARKLRVPPPAITELRLQKHSIDARKSDIRVQLRLDVGLNCRLPEREAIKVEVPQVPAGAPEVIIVGCGPAGIFAALTCLQNGCKPIVLERGKDAAARRFDLAPILREGRVIEESNYCFGEGGAGTFSDGKLYTRATKRGPVRDVYEMLVAHGAPDVILTDAHPHIGSNLLPNVVMAMRKTIIEAGGEVRFGAKVTDLLIEGDTLRGVALADGSELRAGATVLATGHSSRDIYTLLHRRGVLLEQKAFAVGVRIEHPQPTIDQIQYHLDPEARRPDILPAARYRLATKINGRGVHSFCMCPGGFVVPAATENDEVVVNGMSLSRRDSKYANSGMVVTVEPEDTAIYQAEHGVLAGVAYQKQLERAAKDAGGGGQVAPGQRAVDFIAGRLSKTLPETSYFPGLKSARLDQILPDAVVTRMKAGLKKFGRSMKGYLLPEALLIGFETRTSSPVRIPRDEQTLLHPELRGLVPCGEGAGYAGGIVSAALDGRKCAETACQLVAEAADR